MSTVCGTTTGGSDAASIAEHLAPLLEEPLPSGTDTVVVLPDTHYPHHPSTGLVTAPETIEATVSVLRRIAPGAEVAIAHTGGRYLDPELTVEFLGYPAMARRLDAQLVSLDAAETTSTVGANGMVIEVPRPLAEAAVVNLPTFRRSATFGAVAGMVNLAEATIRDRDPASEEVIAAATAIDPTLTILDGLCVFPGVPNRLDLLLACQDVVGLDLAISRGLLDGVTDNYLDPFEDQTVEVTGAPLEELGTDLRVADVSAGGPGNRVKAAYRLYTRFSGDAVPPQFM